MKQATIARLYYQEAEAETRAVATVPPNTKYSLEEDEVIMGAGTSKEKALRLGRPYSSVANRRRKIKETKGKQP